MELRPAEVNCTWNGTRRGGEGNEMKKDPREKRV